ncbi:MAG: winged helix-turn-helix domain-containing protein [bacterium]|nr:winged helix-turn-helix domain-containing protein [bacterium]
MHILEQILSSKTRAAIFRLLFGPARNELHCREIQRRSGLAIGTVRQELQKLERLDLVKAYRDSNRLYYRANLDHLLYEDIRNMVLKTAGYPDPDQDAPPGYRTQSSDTSYRVERMQIEAYRRMTPAEKMRRISDLCQASARIALAGIRQRYPQATERELQLRLAALRLGRETMVKVFGWDPEVEGY